MFIYIYPSYTILLYREDIDIKEFIDRDSASLHKHGQMQTQGWPNCTVLSYEVFDIFNLDKL